MTPHAENLLSRQNADGGWSYRSGSSWVEPTCYALLALAAGDVGDSRSAARGAEWLSRCQRSDGGLSPRENVQESTWLTALALLLPAQSPSHSTPKLDRARALAWVMQQTGRESGWVNRVRLWMLGSNSGDSISFEGWPWYPGTAAWMAPTALSVLALQKVRREQGAAAGKEVDRRIADGRAFLLARRCRDGGWNHGSTRALGYDSDSYPETTGLGLLAVHGADPADLARAIARGQQHLAESRSSEASSWLRLGLLAQGHKANTGELPLRDSTMALSLAILADAADAGRNAFL
jgi:hypothetical protein